MDPKRSGGAVGGSGLKVANILDRPIAKRTSEVRLVMLFLWGGWDGGGRQATDVHA